MILLMIPCQCKRQGEKKLGKVKLEHYKVGYERLYGFLRTKHPEVLAEYRRYLKQVKERIEAALLVGEEI